MSDAPIARYNQPSDTYTFRASAANRCARALVATLMGEQPADSDSFDSVKKAWAEGHEYEPEIIEEVRSRGWKVRRQQAEGQVRVSDRIVIECHVDGIAERPMYDLDDVDSRVLEAKALNDVNFKKFKRHVWAEGLGPSYAIQLAINMKAMARPALYAVMSKTEPRQWNIFPVDEAPADLTSTFERLQFVVLSYEAGEMPPCDRQDFPCSFSYLHEDQDTDALIASAQAKRFKED